MYIYILVINPNKDIGGGRLFGEIRFQVPSGLRGGGQFKEKNLDNTKGVIRD